MAEDWASGSEKRYEQESVDAKLRIERATQRQRIIEIEGTRVWGEICSLVGIEAKKFNAKEEKEILVLPLGPSDKITIFAKLAGGQRELTANRQGININYSARKSTHPTVDRSGHFSMIVTDDNGIVLSDDGGNTTQSKEEVTKRILDAVMGWQ